MSNDFMSIVEYLERDRGIDKEILIQAIESAILQASRKSKRLMLSDADDVKVYIDRVTGNIDVFSGKQKITPENFGRIAAQTAKQVIMQKMKEAETDVLFEEFKNKQDELVNGVIQRFEGGSVVMEVGKLEAVIPKKEQVSKEEYKLHERLRAYVIEVTKSATSVRLIASRTHPNFVKKLFELEVPEIYENVVKIKSIAREAGDRTKIAVMTDSANIDCVGACVGVRGARVKNIVNELRNEKIDIVRWDEDPVQFIKNALAPAEVIKININEKEKSSQVIVAEDQLSLAIGKRGQNARLAAKLTGWNIDIHTKDVSVEDVEKAMFKSTSNEEMQSMIDQAVSKLLQLSCINEEIAKKLVEAGFTSIGQIAEADLEDLEDIEGIDKELAEKIIEDAISGGGDAK